MRNLEFHISQEFHQNGFGVYISNRAGSSIAVARPLVLYTLDEGEACLEPTFRIQKDQAQQLIDELWRVGLRPSEGSSSAGALAATERHLQDMRKLLDHSLGISQ